MYGNASILFIDGNAKIQTLGKNIVSYWNDKSVNIDHSSSTTIVILDRFDATWDAYKSIYPIFVENGKAIMYKSVHKINGEYISDKDRNFKYIIGEEKTEKCDEDKSQECSFGIHISHKMWALKFGHWDDMALLELSVDIDKIVVPIQCDGKVRTSSVVIIREVPKEEYYL